MVRIRGLALLLASLVLQASLLCAQTRSKDRFEAGGQLTLNRLREFQGTDPGGGVRVAWYPHRSIAIESQFDVLGSGLRGIAAYNRLRVQNLFGLKAGVGSRQFALFAKLRSGYTRFMEGSGRVGCIAVFPPPVDCLLAGGYTAYTMDVGGGVEFRPQPRFVLRLDAGDTMLRLPGPSRSKAGVRTGRYLSHGFQVGIGAAVRF